MPALRMSCFAMLFVFSACSLPLGPGCHEDSDPLLDVKASVPAQGNMSYTVVSPRSSNLLMVLSWPDPFFDLQLRATITGCGGHTGCLMISQTAINDGSVNQQTVRFEASLLVDGWEGKTYLVEVLGDPETAEDFRLAVSSEIQCES